MKRLAWILFLPLANFSPAQSPCSSSSLQPAAAWVLSLQAELKQAKVGEMDDSVPSNIADKMTWLKDALSRASDAALECKGPSVDPAELQRNLAQVLHANKPVPKDSAVPLKDDDTNREDVGTFGQDLKVRVNRPLGADGILLVQYSVSIECGDDSMLFAYEFRDLAWRQVLRWEAPALKLISDAFGDFFVTAVLQPSAKPGNKKNDWRIAVAHGTPWCTSRFSGFRIDLLSPGADPVSPQVLWHTERGYSRADFDPIMKASGSAFELRLNADCMIFDNEKCFERRVIYRYSIDSSGHLRRLNPLGINARGFVEEWLSAPWSESRDFLDAADASVLEKVHDRFDPPHKLDDEFVGHSLGPVRACAITGIFQVQVDSTLETIVTGKPGGDSKPLPSHYFHVRELKDGYLMLSAPTLPDPKCAGPDLMPAADK